jgi:hypothetical protein
MLTLAEINRDDERSLRIDRHEAEAAIPHVKFVRTSTNDHGADLRAD